jgi:hypothetical protein
MSAIVRRFSAVGVKPSGKVMVAVGPSRVATVSTGPARETTVPRRRICGVWAEAGRLAQRTARLAVRSERRNIDVTFAWERRMASVPAW